MPNWTPESRLLDLWGKLSEAQTHLYYLGREPHLKSYADKANKSVEIAEQIVKRDIARELNLPSTLYASDHGLRSKLAKLAHDKPEIRKHLLPILRGG